MATRKKKVSPSTRRSLLAAGIMVGVVGGGYAAVRLLAGPGKPTGAGGAPADPTPTRLAPGTTPSSVVLRQGQRSASVKQLQQALLDAGGQPAQEISAGGGADGTYGAATVRALAAAGFTKPSQVTQAGLQAVLKKSATKRPGALPTSSARPAAVAPARRPAAGAPGKAASTSSPKPVVARPANNLPAVGLPLLAAQAAQLQRSILNSIKARDLAKTVAVLKYVRNSADWDQITHGKDYQVWKDNLGRSIDLLLVNQFGAQNPYITKQFNRLGLVWDQYSRVFARS